MIFISIEECSSDEIKSQRDVGRSGSLKSKTTLANSSKEVYEDMLASALGLYGVSSILEAKRMTLEEFNVRKRGYLMKRLEREREIHLQAYLNRLIKATDKSGKKYLYKDFNEFYNEAKARNAVLGNGHGEPVNSDLIAIAKRRQKLLREEENNVE